MFWIKIGVNKKTLFTIEGQNITPGEEIADYRVTVTKESDKSKYQFRQDRWTRSLGILRLCSYVFATLLRDISEGHIPPIDEYTDEPKEWKVTRPPHVKIKGKR